MGGTARRRQLLCWHSRAERDNALTDGRVRASGRSRVTLPGLADALHHARCLNGVVSHVSAAQLHGWEVARLPERPHVTVLKGRRVAPAQRRELHLHFARALPPALDAVTDVETTIRDCLRWLPPAEGLAVVDSALRQGAIGQQGLAALADGARGPGGRQVRHVALLGSAEAANPFESVLRYLALAAGLEVEPQVSLAGLGIRPDLVDRGRRIVLEADSFEWHGGRSALRSDARRYDRLTIEGWLVLRFAWEDVMFDREWVMAVLRDAARMRNNRGSSGAFPA